MSPNSGKLRGQALPMSVQKCMCHHARALWEDLGNSQHPQGNDWSSDRTQGNVKSTPMDKGYSTRLCLLRASSLQDRSCTTSALPLVHFALIILDLGSWELFAWAGLEPWSSRSQPLSSQDFRGEPPVLGFCFSALVASTCLSFFGKGLCSVKCSRSVIVLEPPTLQETPDYTPVLQLQLGRSLTFLSLGSLWMWSEWGREESRCHFFLSYISEPWREAQESWSPVGKGCPKVQWDECLLFSLKPPFSCHPTQENRSFLL
jgi:hypothetical protein